MAEGEVGAEYGRLDRADRLVCRLIVVQLVSGFGYKPRVGTDLVTNVVFPSVSST